MRNTGKSISTSRRKAEVGFIEAMECLPVPEIPAGWPWTYEIKLHRFRLEAVKINGKVTLYSRRRSVLNQRFGYIAAALQKLSALEWMPFAMKVVCNMRSKTSPTWRVMALFIVSVAIADPANAVPHDDACSVLTPAQVSAAVGFAVGAGTYVTPAFKKTCTWNAATNGGGTVTLNLQSLDQFQSEKKSAAYGQPLSAIGGIGDEAYFFGAINLVSIIVKKGDGAFKVAVYAHMPIEKRQAAEKSLALQAIAKP